MIWFQPLSVDKLQARGLNTMVSHIGIDIVEVGEDFVRGRMPVDERTKQPAGFLHGGASVAFAESLMSLAGNCCVDPAEKICLGLEINANHVGSCTQGFVEGVARPLHLGGTTQVWEMRITQGERLVCVSRMTLAVLEKRRGKK